MADEFTVCAAAFFRSIGKDVTTSDEFVMITSLELKWMSPSDSKLMLNALLSKGILVKKGDFIRPSQDLNALDLPLAYRPSADLIDAIHGKVSRPQKKETEPDLFHIMMDVAGKNGIQVRDFVPACTKIQKRLGIDIAVAALIVLRDNGTDISEYTDDVYESICSQ